MAQLQQPVNPGIGKSSTHSQQLPCLGLLCHLNDACISNPCNEGSNCDTNPVNGKAICTCPSGYTGPACSQDVDECALGKCRCNSRGSRNRLAVTYGRCDLSWRTTSLMAWAGALWVLWRPEGQISPHLCLPHQVPTLVSTQASASTHWVLLSASVYKATRGPAVRSMSMSASPTHVRMMPLAWTRLGSSNVYVCQVMKVYTVRSTRTSVPAAPVCTMATALTRSMSSCVSAPKVRPPTYHRSCVLLISSQTPLREDSAL